MKTKSNIQETEELDDLSDESDDYTGLSLNAPKRSPIRRKEKFRAMEFKTEKKHKDRKRSYRNRMKDEFEF